MISFASVLRHSSCLASSTGPDLVTYVGVQSPGIQQKAWLCSVGICQCPNVHQTRRRSVTQSMYLCIRHDVPVLSHRLTCRPTRIPDATRRCRSVIPVRLSAVNILCSESFPSRGLHPTRDRGPKSNSILSSFLHPLLYSHRPNSRRIHTARARQRDMISQLCAAQTAV